MKSRLLFCLFLIFALSACSSKPPQNIITEQRNLGTQGTIPGLPKPALALVPRARTYTGEISPVIRHMLPKSVAEKSLFKVGDQLVRLNGEVITSAAEFDQKIKRAPTDSVIEFRRNSKLLKAKVLLGIDRPRFGAGFEPEGVALVKKTSPFVSFMHRRDITAYTETSINEEQTQLHLNVILDSTKYIPRARLKYTVYDKGLKRAIAIGNDKIDALGSGAKIFKKEFRKSGGFKGPISVALDVEGNQFRFEFQ